jgi:hypothetical protein
LKREGKKIKDVRGERRTDVFGRWGVELMEREKVARR